MKKRIISMLLAGMMVLNSAVVYADADMTGDYTTYVEETENGSEDEVAVQSEAAEVNVSADDNANISVNEASEAENDEVAFTDGDTDEVEITEENPTDVSSQDETDENAEIEFTEAEDVFSENEVAVQTGETITASGTLATGVNWSLSDAGNLQFSGSGAIEKDNGQDNYPWDMTQVFTVTIQRGITEIGSGAFADGTNLTNVAISADTLRTVSADAFQNCSKAEVNLYYSGNAPTVIPAFTGTAKVSVYYKEADVTWTDAFRAAYTDVTWEPCCTINGTTANTHHTYVRTNDEMQIQTDGKNYPTKDNTAYYDATCSVCGNVGKDYNNCINCIDTADLQSDHPYNTETSTDWTVSMEGAEEIILTFDAKTKFETNYDDFFYIYKEDGELYQKFINDQLAGKTVVVPGGSVTLRLTTDYSTDDWGFAVTKAYGTTHKWDAGVITKPAERDQTGTMKKTCQKCGEVVEEVIPAPYIVCGNDTLSLLSLCFHPFKAEGSQEKSRLLPPASYRAFSSQTFPQFSFQFPYPAFSNDTPADELHLLCLLFQAVPQVRRSEDSFSLSISVPEDLFLSYLSTSQQTAFPVCPDIEMPDPSASFHKVPSLLMQYYKKFPKAEVLHTVIRLLFVL